MNPALSFLSTIVGLGLLVLVFYDIYATILRATKHPGPFSEALNRSLWWIITRLTRNLERRWRHRILSAVGPLLMPLLIALFLLTLLTGFALIYLPRLETEFN